MGIPLIEGVFGTEGVLYATAYLTTFNVFVWSHGVLMMKNSFSKKEVLKILKTPAIIAVTVGIICYVTNLRFSNIITRPIEYIASMNTPLAMVVSGITIAQALVCEVVDKLVKEGIEPPIFKSSNVDGGDEHNHEMFEKYHGYWK